MDADEVLADRQAEARDDLPDAAAAELEKCKTPVHLRVVVGFGAGHGPSDTTIRWVGTLVCRNPSKAEPAWGALIAPAGKEQGMHLFASAVEVLAAHLPAVATDARAGGSGNVALQHTVNGVFKTWRTFTPDAAEQAGRELAALIPPA